jgi:hypothetical protein
MTRDEILAKVAKGELPIGDASKMLDALAPREPGGGGWHPSPIRANVSEKRCVHLSGCNHSRFGLSLYAKDMLYVIDHGDEIRAFIEAHKSELSWERGDKVAVKS